MELQFVYLRSFDVEAAAVFRTAEERDAYMHMAERTLIENPERGDLMPRTGGARKLRIALPGRGKRGGARVVYLYVAWRRRIYFLTVYAKNVQATLSREEEQMMHALVTVLRQEKR